MIHRNGFSLSCRSAWDWMKVMGMAFISDEHKVRFNHPWFFVLLS